MNSKFLIVGVIVIVLIAAGVAVAFMNGYAPQTGVSTTPQSTTILQTTTISHTNVTTQSTTIVPVNRTLFSNTQYAAFAYQIFPAVSLSQNGKVATSDVVISNSSTPGQLMLVYMNFTGSGTSYSSLVGPGDTLYFIDQNLGDDSPSHDANSGEDGYALVDSQGYVISVNYPLPGT
ncbi:MAG: hypothetical protein KGH59_03580 [Candidatus Micrarchaeota archaeon]|nr:hypothetical protein [Candidatus Micrarchaeota archaeon]